MSATAAAKTTGADLPTLDVETEELDWFESFYAYRRALSSEAGQKMAEFLDSEDSSTDESELSGRRVTVKSGQDHTLLTVPLETGNDHDLLELRVFDEGVSAQAYVNGEGYMTTPTVETKTASAGAEGVIELSEWDGQHGAQRTVEPAASWDRACVASGTFDAGGPACTFLQGIAAVAGGILLLIPEPGTTAVGSVALAGILAGSCSIAQALENGLDLNCSITEIGLCVSIPSPVSPTGVYAYPAVCV